MEDNTLLNEIISKLQFPIHYDMNSQSILDENEKPIIDIRGWNWIKRLREDQSECAKMQDALGEEVCKLLNEKYAS